MSGVQTWTGRECRLLRQALRLSVRDFASVIGVSARTVSKWETNEGRRTPRPEMQRALDTMLHRGTQEERTRFDQALAAGAASAFALGTVGDPEHAAAAAIEPRRFLGGSLVEGLARHLADLKAGDGQLGGEAALPLVLDLLAAIDHFAGEVKPQVRRQMLSVGADTAEFTGWLYRDAHDHGRARYWYDRATEWAQEAGNLPMQGYVLLKKAQLAWDRRQPAPMLTLSQAATQGPWQLPTRIQAEAIQQVARAEAMLGAPITAVDAQLRRARDLFETAAASETSGPFGSHYAAPLLLIQAALCYTEAGEPLKAIDVYEEALTEA